MIRLSPALLLASAVAAGPTGCQRQIAPAQAAEAPVVPVSRPVGRNVVEYVEYTGRTDAVQSVGVRARVTGFLTKMPFEEGAEVPEGELLFEIDPRPYRALYDQALSQVTFNQAQLKLARATFDRDKTLQTSFAVSQQQLDQDQASVEEAEARIKVAQAALETANLNLSFTQVRAPLKGRVSRYYYTLGNLVTQDQTLLTTIVATDPMYAYFDIEQKTFQRLAEGRAADGPSAGKGRPAHPGFVAPLFGAWGPVAALSRMVRPGVPVDMGLEGETGLPHRGALNFVNNQVNPSTGTVAVRAVFKNVLPDGRPGSLIPGMFVRVRLPVGEPYAAQLVIDRAIGSDQDLKFVYVVDAENKVQYRRVTTGSLQDDGLRVVEDGLKPDDWVVVGGLQQLRPKTAVKPDRIPMPTVNLATELPTPSRRKPQPPPPAGKPAKKG